MKFTIDLLRHGFSLAVILQHMTSGSRYSPETNEILRTLVDWVDGAVLGFFLLSGFLYKSPLDAVAFLRRQAARLLAPFLLFSLLYAVALALLGKETLESGLWATLRMRGAGMQLYFLPFLFLVTTVYACLDAATTRWRNSLPAVLLPLLLLATVLLPTPSSTGPQLQLLPYYLAAYVIGVQAQRMQNRAALATFLLLALAVACGGLVDARLYDLGGVMLLFGCTRYLWHWMPQKRLPGSGGVYLLHTPVTNFAISTLLVHLAVQQLPNALLTVALTYVTCLAATLLFIRLLPRYRWLLLE
jgi:hypothetical protein